VGKGKENSEVGGGQSGTNQGKVWTSIRTTSFKGRIPSKLRVNIWRKKTLLKNRHMVSESMSNAVINPSEGIDKF
jgi:hypothetical protein